MKGVSIITTCNLYVVIAAAERSQWLMVLQKYVSCFKIQGTTLFKGNMQGSLKRQRVVKTKISA